MQEFLQDLELEQLFPIFEHEHITMDILMDMSHDDLASVGVSAFGHRHKLIRKIKEMVRNGGAEPAVPVGMATASKHVGTQLIELSPSDKDYIAVSEEVKKWSLRKRSCMYIGLRILQGFSYNDIFVSLQYTKTINITHHVSVVIVKWIS